MPTPSRAPQIAAALLAAVDNHPNDLVRVVSQQLGLSRAAVGSIARALVGSQHLLRVGTTRPVYRRGPVQRRVFRYLLTGLAEDRVWREDVAPLLADLPANVLEICEHGITEMVNNAIDHSGGQWVRVLVDRSPDLVRLSVHDDGVGIFQKISAALGLADPRLSLLELAKGKFTTDPSRHSGEGVFFTSRMFDRFGILAGELVFDHEDARDDDFLFDIGDPDDVGTLVSMVISARSTRTIREVFERYSSGPDEYSFARTTVPLRMAIIGNEHLVSRSQARRVLQRVERFRSVMFDFEDVAQIGQAFADEIFRVFANAHPEVELVAIHAAPEVQQMIRRAEVARDEARSLLRLRRGESSQPV